MQSSAVKECRQSQRSGMYIATHIQEQILLNQINNDNESNNGNILFDHTVHIEITIFNSLENQIINWSGDYS